MKTLYLDCFAGISGDMFVGAMLDVGLDLSVLQRELSKLPLAGYRLEANKVDKRGLQATHFKVILQEAGSAERLADSGEGADAVNSHAHEHRHLHEILALINDSDLSAQVKQQASAIFSRLGEAEAHVHGIPIEQVHFHEVGAVDAIVDIVSAAIAIEQLAVERITASPLHLGSGMVKMSHGLYPIPAPATAELIAGIPTYSTDAKGELTTPTGAAIVTTLAHTFGPMPAMTISRTGYGAGTKDRDFPNVVRAMIGEQASINPVSYTPVSYTPTAYLIGEAIVIEANIDDMNPQHYEPLMAHLLTAGALDVALIPIQMKKQRPGTQLQLIAKQENLDQLLSVVFQESSTIGVRTYPVTRFMLPREIQAVQTIYGPIQVKIARYEGRIVNAVPEYEDCRKCADAAHVSIKIVTATAISAAHKFMLDSLNNV